MTTGAQSSGARAARQPLAVLVAAICFSTAACEPQVSGEDGGSATGAISYDGDGSRRNVLDPTQPSFDFGVIDVGEIYGFRANLPAGTELRVEMTGMGGFGSWLFDFGPSPHWSATDWVAGGTQTFTARHDGIVDFEEFSFEYDGSALIEIFEDGASTPTWSYTVTWAP